MEIAEALFASVMVGAALATTATAADTPPRWAYIEDNRDYKPPVDDGNLVRVPKQHGRLHLDPAPHPIHRADLAP